jgi:hypothetical protein
MVPGYHDRMIVSWVSNSTDGSPLVVWGVAADALNESAPATHDTYTAADFTNCMGIAAINTLDSPFPHLSSHDLRSVTPHVSRITLIRPCHCVTHVALTSACHMSPTAADAAVPATTTPPPASCSFTPATCTTQCCSRCSPPAGTAAPSRHTSHVTRHTSHVTRHTSHVTRRYYYSFGSSLGGWSQVYSFVAPRVAGDTTAFTFLYEQHFAMQCWACDRGAGTLPMQAWDSHPSKS